MNAWNSVMLRPEMPPALPEVMMEPATIFTEPMKITQPDHLKRGDFGGNKSTGSSTLGAITDFVGAAGPDIGKWIASL